jgi:hypothetical protein
MRPTLPVEANDGTGKPDPRVPVTGYAPMGNDDWTIEGAEDEDMSPASVIGSQEGGVMAKDHGPSVKNDKQYEGLRKKGMSKQRAAAISNSPGSSSRGGKKSSSGGRSTTASRAGGTKAQKAAAGRKGGKKSS